MPIYMKIDCVKGTVSDHDHKNASSGNGGVWRTTNFLTSDTAQPSAPGPHVKVFSGATGGNLVPLSRISLANGMNAVDGADPSAQFKLGQLLDAARSHRTPIKVFLCPGDAAVQTSANNRGKLIVGVDNIGRTRMEPLGRLLVGTDQGVWRSAGTTQRMISVDFIVTGAGGNVIATHRIERASTSHHSGGVLVVMGDGSVR